MLVMVSDYDSSGGGAGKICQLETQLAKEEKISIKIFYAITRRSNYLHTIFSVLFVNLYFLLFFLINRVRISEVVVHTYSFLPMVLLVNFFSAKKFTFVAHDYSLIAPCKSLYHKNNENLCSIRGYSKACLSEKCGYSLVKKSYLSAMLSLVKPTRIRTLSSKSSELFKQYTTFPLIEQRNIQSFQQRMKKVDDLPDKFVLFAGRYTFDKGFDLFLILAERFPSINFVCCGTGRIHSSEYVCDLGWLSGEQISFLISKSSLVVYPSRQIDADPLIVQQSILYNKPVLVPSWNASANDVGQHFGLQYVFDDILEVNIEHLLIEENIDQTEVKLTLPKNFRDIYV